MKAHEIMELQADRGRLPSELEMQALLKEKNIRFALITKDENILRLYLKLNFNLKIK